VRWPSALLVLRDKGCIRGIIRGLVDANIFEIPKLLIEIQSITDQERVAIEPDSNELNNLFDPSLGFAVFRDQDGNRRGRCLPAYFIGNLCDRLARVVDGIYDQDMAVPQVFGNRKTDVSPFAAPT